MGVGVGVDDGAGVVLVTPSVPVIVILPNKSITVAVSLFFTVMEVGVEVTSTPFTVVTAISPFVIVDEIT